MSIYLVDYENVNLGGLNGIETLNEGDRVFIFYGQNPGYIPFEKHILICRSKAEIEYLRVDRQAKNYLDFQLATYSGYLIAKYDDRDYVIVSKDTGFDSIVNFWNRDPEGLGVRFTRRESIAVPAPAKSAQKQPREKQEKNDGKEQSGVARPSSFMMRIAAAAPVSEESLPTEEPVQETPAADEKTEPAEAEGTKTRSRRSRRRRGKKRETPAETAGVLPEIADSASSDAEETESREQPAEDTPVPAVPVLPDEPDLEDIRAILQAESADPDDPLEIAPEDDLSAPDALMLGVAPTDFLSDRARRIIEADDMIEAMRTEKERDLIEAEEAKEAAKTAEEAAASEAKAEAAAEEKKEPTAEEPAVPQSRTRKPRIRRGKERRNPAVSSEQEVKAETPETGTAETPVKEETPVPEKVSDVTEIPAAEEKNEAPVTEAVEEPAPVMAAGTEETKEEIPASEPVKEVESPRPFEAAPEKPASKPAVQKLPERVKTKIRDAVRDEKLSSGAYTQLYNRILRSEDEEKLKSELVKAFSADKGAKLFELIRGIFADYLNTRK